MITYFGGAEVPHYRELMAERGVLRMAMNYFSHFRRAKDPSWSIDEHYPPGSRILVESGASAFNRNGVNVPAAEIAAVAANYYDFIANNLERIDAYLEFDAVGLGSGYIEERRGLLDSAKGIVVWHADSGEEELRRLAAAHERVAVSENTLNEESLIPLYRQIGRVTKLHLLGVDRSLMLKGIVWHSCSFTSWISSSVRGETFIWAGRELRRYDTRQKGEARRKHAALITSLGLDLDKIKQDNVDENLRLSLWSWGQHFAYFDRGPSETVTQSPAWDPRETASKPPAGVDATDPEWAHDLVTQGASERREKTSLPGLETVAHTIYVTDPQDGTRKPARELRVQTADPDIRRCEGCFLAAKCPEYQPGESCAYSIPVRVASKEQRAALFDALIEMQAQRVFFMRLAEEGDGGYADKNLSMEIDRLRKLLQTKDDLENTGFSLVVKAKERGETQPGLLSRLFGSEGTQPAITEGNSIPAEQALLEMGVIDAEIIGEEVTR